MRTLSLEVPESVLSALRLGPEELGHELRLAAAIHWYQQGRISQGCAAELAGISRREFLAELARREIDVFVVDMKDLRQELERS